MLLALLPMILRKWGLQKYRVLSTICKGLLKNRIAHLQKNQRRGMLKAQRKQISRKGVLNMELTYTNQGDYRLPNLIAPEEPEVHLGKYALLRRSYLKNLRRILFTNLLTSGKLNAHLMEIEEAAQIDGCTPFQTFWKVTFPLLGPCTGSMVILNGLGIWNDYLMPYLALPSGKAKTITVEIASFVGQYTARWDIVFAGTVISIVPALIIFCMFQKYFVKGITAGAAKG